MGQTLSFYRKPSISVIIPTYNEEQTITETIRTIRRQTSAPIQIIISDGYSTDATLRTARRTGVKTILSPGGRAAQLNDAATHAKADTLLFLHADTKLPRHFDRHITRTLSTPRVVAGAFSLSIDGPGFPLRLVERIANWRSRLLQMPYGDQALFLRRHQFQRLGGYNRLLPFLDDYEITCRLKKHGRIAIAPQAVLTSARRWETVGVVRTTLMNQCVIVAYHCGVPVPRLRDWYRQTLIRAMERKRLRDGR